MIVAEPYPPPPSEALSSTPTTFVAAFAMPNKAIPNNTDLRNFLVPLNVLESVSGMRFLGAATGEAAGAAASQGTIDEDAKLSLDKEALQVRTRAGVAPLSGEWRGGGKRLALTGQGGDTNAAAAAEGGRPRLFRHLCTATSCRGL